MANLQIEHKIRCWNRLFDLTDCEADLVMFLQQEKLLTAHQISELQNTLNTYAYCALIVQHLETAVKEERLALLNYDWIILPNESIEITIITDTVRKDFTYGT